jgi:hypothetical protein
MSPISPEINVITNSGYAEIHIEKCLWVELLDGWEKWSLKDVIRTIKTMKKRASV